jgi:hypothetical protein
LNGRWDVYRLVYKSRSIGEISREMVRSIMNQSGEMNRDMGITGALIATDTHFLQVLEGDFQSLNKTFMRIARDPRHSEVSIIAFSPAASRLFEGWAMRGIGIFDLNKDLEEELKKKYGQEDGSLCFPTEEWAALSLVNDVHMMSHGGCD